MNQEKVVAGIDVIKATLDVYIAPSGEVRQFQNDAGGRRGLRKMLHKAKVELVVLEATGRYHRPVHISLDDAGFRVAVVSPLQARRFAQALGQLAKTDPIDAAMLARLGQAMDPAATPPRSGAHFRLGDLARARAQLVKTRTALSNSIKEYETPETVAAFKQLVNDTDREISRIEAAIRGVIVDDPEHARRDRILGSIPGIGPVTAAVLCAELPELGTARPPPGRFPGGCRPVPGRQRKTGREAILQGWPSRASKRPLHGRDDSQHVQRRDEAALRAPDQRRQAAQGCGGRRHAQAHHPRQRARARRPRMGAVRSRSSRRMIVRPVEKRASVSG